MQPLSSWFISSFWTTRHWKHICVDVLLVMLTIILITVADFLLHLHARPSTLLLVCLFIILYLLHKRRYKMAVLATILICLDIGFFLTPPLFSFSISEFEDAVALVVFLLLAGALYCSYVLVQERVDRARKRQREMEEQLRKQTEEARRRDQETRIFYEALQTREEQQKDLQHCLHRIARAIEESFAERGISNCAILLPGPDGRLKAQTWATETVAPEALSSEEESIVSCIVERKEPMVFMHTSLITCLKGNYLRMIVADSDERGQRPHRYSYMIPLKSGQKVIGVLRLFKVDDSSKTIAESIRATEREFYRAPTELFTKLQMRAISFIEQELIDEALKRQEYIEAELAKRTEELHNAIISSVSHDFRVPLAQIKRSVESLLCKEIFENDEIERQQALELINELDWLEHVLTRLLHMARIEHGALKLEKELYPVDQLVVNTLDMSHLHSLAKERLDIHISYDLPAVEVDPLLIQQVLANLLENAVRYSPVGSPIAIEAQAEDEYVIIAVADCGPGIPPIDKERIFEKFYRVGKPNSPSQAQGSGLGLAICRGFVEAHGGHIWVENREGCGAKFLFTLPILSKRESYEKEDSCRR